MVRNRMIKPEFWCDKKTNSLPPIVQLLFIGTWNFADDTGVCRADITYLQSNIFPYTSVTRNQIKEALNTLIQKKLVLFGTYNDEEYIFIKNFPKHQKIDHPSKKKNIEADYKAIFGLEANTRRALDEPSLLTKNKKENEKENVNVNVREDFSKILKNGEQTNVSSLSLSDENNADSEFLRKFRAELERQKQNENRNDAG